jgi:hypothetical protein
MALVTAVAAGAAPAPDADWTSYGHDAQVNSFTAAASFTTKTKTFVPVWRVGLDGGVTASPLAARVAAAGLVFFAATSEGNVYAVAGGKVLWQRALGTVVANGGCGTYGINSTGTIDAKHGLLYVAAASGYLHALRLVDGSEADGYPIQVVRRPRTEYVWGGLRLVGNRLYVPVASYCDEPGRLGPAEGRLDAYDVTAPASAPLVFDPVPGMRNLGSIWGWGGVSVSPDGRDLYTGVGNAEPDVADGYSDSMVQLTPDLSEVVASYRPVSATPGDDVDLGAAPVLFHPLGCPAYLAANSKSGELLVWRQDRLTSLVARIALSDGKHAFVGAPSWSPRQQMLYDAGATATSKGTRLVGTMALAVSSKCTFVQKWFTATGSGAMPQPLVAGDLVASTGGFGGGFVVNRAGSGVVVWRFATQGAAIAPLISAGGLLVGGDMGGNLYAFRPR